MSLGNWLHNTKVQRALGAFSAIVVALAFSIWLWPSEPPIPQRQALEDYSTFAKALDPECFDILEKPSAASPYQKDECADKDTLQRKGYRDLAQSIRASNASEEAAWLSYVQTRAAVVGAAFLVLTLAATAWAAGAAADAAEIAKTGANAAIQAARAAVDSVKATQQATAVAENIGKAQVKAYMAISDCYFWMNAGVPTVKFRYFNTGQTPARKIVIELAIDHREPISKRFVKFTYPDDLAAQDGRDVEIGFREWGSDPLFQKAVTIYIGGRLTYADVFNEGGSLILQYWLFPKGNMPTQPVKAARPPPF